MTKLLEQIKEKLSWGSVSFAELSRIEGFNGDLEIKLNHPSVSNVVLWSGLSEEAIEALEVIRKEGEYIISPSTILVYLMDGVSLNLPIAKSKRHYKKPHWAPVVFTHRKEG